MLTSSEIQELDQKYYLPVFNRYPVSIVRGKGCTLWDAEGKPYLDALGGIAVVNTGHCHPKIVEAIQHQAATLMHNSNFFSTPQQALLAKKLVEKSNLDYAFFTNSGAESIETAIKLARKFAFQNDRGGTVISMTRSFHGRTMATIATGGAKMQQGFTPIPKGFIQASIEDKEGLLSLIDENVAAILIEPVQGEGGVYPISNDFLIFLREICDKNKITLIFDEIQTGIGRTGSFFAFQQTPVRPDIMALAKGLGSGFPIGATLCTKEIGDAMNFGDHGTTFGGNPLACAAALATIEVIDEEGLCLKSKENGEWFRKTVEEQFKGHPKFSSIRGRGLMIGIELNCPAKPVVLKMLEMGVIANATAENVVRIVPPLIISKEELTVVLETLKKALEQVEK